MTRVSARFDVAPAALRGGMPVAGLAVNIATNNNRNNASLPRAGD